MKPKKSAKADLRKRRALFFEIGFVMAIAAVIFTFSTGQTERVTTVVSRPADPVPEDIVIPDTGDKRPEVRMPANQFLADFITVVPSHVNLDYNYEFPEPGDIDIMLNFGSAVDDTEDPDDIPLLIVADMPGFLGGDLATFRNWVMKHMEYPRVAADNGIQGKVQLRFVVERDGSVSGIETDFAPDRSLSEEAMRVVAMSPKWEPGRNQGKPARVMFVLPIEFRLNY